jgi:selenium metabolism protein YedF
MEPEVILIQSEFLGRGEDELGMMLMSNFLRLLEESEEKPEKMLFWNTGVRLVCEGSWALEHLKTLETGGIEILACRTCLDYFELSDKQAVGKPTNMAATIKSMMNSRMVCL